MHWPTSRSDYLGSGQRRVGHSALRFSVAGAVAVLLALVMLVAGSRVFRSQPTLADARVWTQEFGSQAHDAATSVAADTAGTAYVAGWTAGALPGQTFAGGPRDVFLRQYSRNGAAGWTRQFGTASSDTAMDVTVDTTVAVYVVGQTDGALPNQTRVGASDAFVRKYNSSGTELWTRQFGSRGSTAAARVVVDAAANVYVAGWSVGALSNQTSPGGSDAFVRKYAGDGTELWTRQFGTAGHDRATSIALDGAGAIYVLSQDGTPNHTFVRKFAPDGTLQWALALAPPEGEFIAALAVDSDGNMYVGGRTDGDEGEAFVRKYASDGVQLWYAELGRPASTSPVSMVTDLVVDASGVYVTGQAGGLLPGQAGQAAGGFDIFLLELHPGRPGVRLLSRRLASAQNDIATKLALDGLGDLFLAGWSAGELGDGGVAGPSDAFVARLL
jgi:hypothetical protein